MSNRADAVRVIEGMVLAEATAVAGSDTVRTHVNQESDPPELLQVILSIGEPSTVIAIEGPDVDHLLSDPAVCQKVQRQIRAAVAVLRPGQ